MGSSESTPRVRRELEDGVLVVTLDRPDRRNAIDAEMRDELVAAIGAAAVSGEVGGVVLTGAGGAFCAGGDVGRFEELHDARVYRHVSHRLTELLDAVERLEKPVVAAIDGVATGAGLTLALAADWRVASPRTRILFREGRLNMVPTHGGIARLVKLVGLARAKEALLGGDDLDAERALALGLVTEVVDGDVVSHARARVKTMLTRAPLSYGAAKRLLIAAADTDTRTVTLAESLAQTALLQTEDHREGLAAARERRAPAFSGR